VSSFQEATKMQTTTIDIINAALRADATVGPADRTGMLDGIRNWGRHEAAPEQDRIIKRSEAARLLGRHPRSVDRLVAQGLLRKVMFPNRQRASGFRLSEVDALIAGGCRE